MNKNNIIFVVLCVLVLFVVSSIYFYPNFKEASIKSEINKANYCQIESDCVDAGGKCPFGCYNYVNKNEVQRISNLINSYDSKCVYGCIECQKAICENNKCKLSCE